MADKHAELSPQGQAELARLKKQVGEALSRVRTKQQTFAVLRSALGMESEVYQGIARRGGLTHREGMTLEFAHATIGAIVRTLEASPLYDTPALADQLRHSLAVHLKDATVEEWEPAAEPEKDHE